MVGFKMNKFVFIFPIIFWLSGPGAQTKNPTCVFTNYTDLNSTHLRKLCSDVVIDGVLVPAGETMTLKLADGATLTFKGNTSFEYHAENIFFLEIKGKGLTVRGEKGSFFDCQGQRYWDGNGQWGTTKRPFMKVSANNSVFEDIKLINIPKDGFIITNCHNLLFQNVLIDNSLGDEVNHPDGKFGHNTDGFAIKESHNITIRDCTVYNQDDCVVVGSGSNLHISNMYCHNSHGLSISTGLSNDSIIHNTIKNLTFCDSFVDGGENGIHIKTRKTGGYGNITDVVYRNIVFTGNTRYGINIQQNYANTPAGQELDPTPRGNVPIRNLTLENIYGVVNSSAVGIYINCADGACLNWTFKNISVSGQANNTCNFTPDGFEC